MNTTTTSLPPSKELLVFVNTTTIGCRLLLAVLLVVTPFCGDSRRIPHFGPQ
jgi:hypothetical protein